MSTVGIPPNGFVGAAHQSAAVRNHIASHSSKTLGHTRSKKRRRKKTPSATRSTRSASTGQKRSKKNSSGLRILKAGSAAAIAWGKKMQAARKKKAKGAA